MSPVELLSAGSEPENLQDFPCLATSLFINTDTAQNQGPSEFAEKIKNKKLVMCLDLLIIDTNFPKGSPLVRRSKEATHSLAYE